MIETYSDVKKIREELGLSQEKLAELAGISRLTITSGEKRGSKLSVTAKSAIETAFKLFNSRSSNVKEIHTLKFNATEIPQPVSEYKNKNNSFIVLSEDKYIMKTKLVTVKAKAGYLTGWGDEEYLETLPEHAITITNSEKGLPKGMYMSFEIDGDSMDYDGRDAIPNRSIVTGRQISRALWTSKLHLNNYKDFIIVCYGGILCKRIIDHDVKNGTITIHSLNPDKETYPDEVIDLKQVMQIFNIVKKETVL